MVQFHSYKIVKYDEKITEYKYINTLYKNQKDLWFSQNLGMEQIVLLFFFVLFRIIRKKPHLDHLVIFLIESFLMELLNSEQFQLKINLEIMNRIKRFWRKKKCCVKQGLRIHLQKKKSILLWTLYTYEGSVSGVTMFIWIDCYIIMIDCWYFGPHQRNCVICCAHIFAEIDTSQVWGHYIITLFGNWEHFWRAYLVIFTEYVRNVDLDRFVAKERAGGHTPVVALFALPEKIFLDFKERKKPI